ncbi:Dyp-type peroxidase, partial [Nocardia sp. NPDC058499]|uniref:Dyp-type peroxidase n=1 Tax=Nocardia sp. NPDC058499 TaxID=3346530 RepID=UPI00365F00E9
MSRRRLLGASAAAVGAAGAGAGIYGVAEGAERAEAATGTDTAAWDGPRQAGIATTPPQAHAIFVGLDLLPKVGPTELIGIMKVWTADIARLTQGRPALADTEPELAAAPARLTVTVGYGPGVFVALGRPEAAPPWLAPLPAFTIDRLDLAYTGADLALQVCADDPVTVAHAVRVLLKNVRSLVTVRWTQRGFRRGRGGGKTGQNKTHTPQGGGKTHPPNPPTTPPPPPP